MHNKKELEKASSDTIYSVQYLMAIAVHSEHFPEQFPCPVGDYKNLWNHCRTGI